MTHLFHTLRPALNVCTVAALLCAAITAATAQTSPSDASAQNQSPVTVGAALARLHPENSFSVGAAAQLTASRQTDSPLGQLLTTSVAPSAEVFATFRQTYKPALGYSVNFGYSRTTDRYSYSPRGGTSGYNSQTNLQVNMFEVSLSYIARQHLAKHLSMFEEVGAGTLAFASINTGDDLPARSNRFLPAGIGGIGVDYHLSRGFGLRAQFRGLLVHHPYPDYSDSPKLQTVVSGPALSLTYAFGKHPVN